MYVSLKKKRIYFSQGRIKENFLLKDKALEFFKIFFGVIKDSDYSVENQKQIGDINVFLSFNIDEETLTISFVNSQDSDDSEYEKDREIVITGLEEIRTKSQEIYDAIELIEEEYEDGDEDSFYIKKQLNNKFIEDVSENNSVKSFFKAVQIKNGKLKIINVINTSYIIFYQIEEDTNLDLFVSRLVYPISNVSVFKTFNDIEDVQERIEFIIFNTNYAKDESFYNHFRKTYRMDPIFVNSSQSRIIAYNKSKKYKIDKSIPLPKKINPNEYPYFLNDDSDRNSYKNLMIRREENTNERIYRIPFLRLDTLRADFSKIPDEQQRLIDCIKIS